MVTLTACGIGGRGVDGEFYTHGQKVRGFVDQVYNFDVVEGGYVLAAKKNTWKYNWMVVEIQFGEDEYVEYYAVNMDGYTPGLNEGDWYEFIFGSLDSGNMREVIPTDNVFNNYRDEEGNLYEVTSASTKDLEKMAAANELIQTSFLAKKLSSEFALSEKRSQTVAKLISNYSKLGNKRALTDADGDIFTKSLLGHDYKTVESALMKKMAGNDSDYQELIEKSAALNSVSPEQLNSLFEEFIK